MEEEEDGPWEVGYQGWQTWLLVVGVLCSLSFGVPATMIMTLSDNR